MTPIKVSIDRAENPIRTDARRFLPEINGFRPRASEIPWIVSLIGNGDGFPSARNICQERHHTLSGIASDMFVFLLTPTALMPQIFGGSFWGEGFES